MRHEGVFNQDGLGAVYVAAHSAVIANEAVVDPEALDAVNGDARPDGITDIAHTGSSRNLDGRRAGGIRQQDSLALGVQNRSAFNLDMLTNDAHAVPERVEDRHVGNGEFGIGAHDPTHGGLDDHIPHADVGRISYVRWLVRDTGIESTQRDSADGAATAR